MQKWDGIIIGEYNEWLLVKLYDEENDEYLECEISKSKLSETQLKGLEEGVLFNLYINENDSFDLVIKRRGRIDIEKIKKEADELFDGLIFK